MCCRNVQTVSKHPDQHCFRRHIASRKGKQICFSVLRSQPSRIEASQAPLFEPAKRHPLGSRAALGNAGRVGGEQSDRQGAMRHRTPRARGQPLRAVCPRNVVRLFRPLGRNWMPRIYSGHPTVRLPQTEAWAERERVPSGHNCRRQLATGRPEQIQEPGTAVPGTPIFANYA